MWIFRILRFRIMTFRIAHFGRLVGWPALPSVGGPWSMVWRTIVWSYSSHSQMDLYEEPMDLGDLCYQGIPFLLKLQVNKASDGSQEVQGPTWPQENGAFTETCYWGIEAPGRNMRKVLCAERPGTGQRCSEETTVRRERDTPPFLTGTHAVFHLVLGEQEGSTHALSWLCGYGVPWQFLKGHCGSEKERLRIALHLLSRLGFKIRFL